MYSKSIIAAIGGAALTGTIAAIIVTSAIAPASAAAPAIQAQVAKFTLDAQPASSEPCDSLVPPKSTPRTVSYVTTTKVGIKVCDPSGNGWAFNESTTDLAFQTAPGTVTATLDYGATFDPTGVELMTFDSISYAGANVYDMTSFTPYPATCTGEVGVVLQSGDSARIHCDISIPVEALSTVHLAWQIEYDTISASNSTRVTDGSFGPQWSFTVSDDAPVTPEPPVVTPPVVSPPTTPEAPTVVPAPPVIVPPTAPTPVEKPKVTG